MGTSKINPRYFIHMRDASIYDSNILWDLSDSYWLNSFLYGEVSGREEKAMHFFLH
jgi:hypothetical protein